MDCVTGRLITAYICGFCFTSFTMYWAGVGKYTTSTLTAWQGPNRLETFRGSTRHGSVHLPSRVNILEQQHSEYQHELLIRGGQGPGLCFYCNWREFVVQRPEIWARKRG